LFQVPQMAHDHPKFTALAVGATIFLLWVAGGLATVLATAAIVDLALVYVERRRERRRLPVASAHKRD
jgi:hypothetical protein